MKKWLLVVALAALLAALFAIPVFGAEAQAEGELPNDIYVEDGLVLFLTAMDGYQDTVSLGANSGTWTDVYGKTVTLTGGAWRTYPTGGVGYRMTKAEYDGGAVGGIVLDGHLPMGSYSVETVLCPIGITNADGTRYVHPNINDYGVSHDQAFVLGPLKSYTGVSLRSEKKEHSLENRWYYHAQGGWHDAKCVVRITDEALRTKGDNDVISYGIYHTQTAMGNLPYSIFNIHSEGKLTARYASETSDFIPTAASEQHLRWMYRFPGDVYAIRVYDHPLTEAERNRNHTADLFAYYGLDTELFALTRSLMGDADSLYAPFAEIGFNLTPAEAERKVLACMQQAWMAVDGVAARLDNEVGIRGVFTLNLDTVDVLNERGLRVEVGVGYAFGEATDTEDLDGYVTVYGENGKNEALFLTDRQFALAIHYKNCTAEHYVEKVTFLGIYRIYDGDELLYEFVFPIGSENYDGSVFSVYRYLSLTDYAENAFVQKTVNNCYRKEIFYVSPDGNDGGNGTESDPYASVDAAYDALLATMLTTEKSPTEFVLHLMEGTHRISSPIEITGEGYKDGYFRLTVTGDGADKSVLSGSREISGWGFEEVSGTEYFVYQFQKEGNSYPDFRYFFADGRVATVATEGANRAAGGNQHVTRYNRDHQNPGTAQPKFYLDRELFEGVPASALAGAELHMTGQWCFNIVRIERVDMSDTADGGRLVAVYINSGDYDAMAAPNSNFNNRTYWLENSLAFLDEPGEYYYDRASGKLYYFPPYGTLPEEMLLEYGVAEQLITVRDASNVTVSNITLTGVDDRHVVNATKGYRGGQAGDGAPAYAAIAAKDCTYFTVKDCVICEVAGDGIHLTGRLRNTTIHSNELRNVGATALRLGNFAVNTFTEENSIKDLLVENNYINGTGWFRRESCGVMLSQAWGAKIYSNTIRNCTYSAINVGTHRGPAPDSFVGEVFNNRDVEVAYNYITDFVTDMRDGAAIYTLGGSAPTRDHSYFNFIYENLIVWSDITGDIHGQAHTSGLYNDNSSSNWHDYKNVQLINPDRYWRGMYYHYVQADPVHDILIEDNYYAGIPEELPAGWQNAYSMIYFHINGDKRIYERGTVFCNDPWDLPSEAIFIMDMSGSSLCPPDVDMLLNGAY